MRKTIAFLATLCLTATLWCCGTAHESAQSVTEVTTDTVNFEEEMSSADNSEINDATSIFNSDKNDDLDTDYDGVCDYDEVNVYGTDPENSDTDNDSVDDGSEIKLGLDPCNPKTFGVPDSEYKVSQTIAADSRTLSAINTEDSPYAFSIDLTTNLDAERNMSIVHSGYSYAIQNDAMIGASLDVSISDACNPENMVIKFNVKEPFRENTLNLYSEYEEFKGLKRLNIFKFDEESNMLLPIDTEFEVEEGIVFAKVDELGTYCIMDMEIWLNNLGVELNPPSEN